MKIRELERDHKKKVKAQEAVDLRIEQLNDNKDTKFAQIGVATALVVVGLFAGIFGVNKVMSTSSTSTSIENTTGTASESTEAALRGQLIDQIQEAVLNDVETYLASLENEDGYSLSDEEIQSIIMECQNNLTKYLANTDLINLTDTERETLLEGIRDEIINTVLDQQALTNYFTESDYKNIAEYISKLTDTGLAKELAELTKTVQANNTKVTAVNNTQDKEIDALQSALANIQTAMSNGQTQDSDYMNKLKSEIDANADLTDEYKAILEASIDDLSVSSASNLTAVTAALKAAIEKDEIIAATTKANMLALIEANADATSEGMASLQAALLAELGDTSSTLTSTITQLSSTVSAEIQDLRENYRIYTFDSVVSGGNIVINQTDLHAYSDVNILYDTDTTGLTFNYTLSEGNLTIAIQASDGYSVPSNITGTIYVDNGVNNASN